MRKLAVIYLLLCGVWLPTGAIADSAVKRAIIQQSINAYPGNCPCPYNTDRAGRRCGKRSAWSKPRGASPKCYERDVSQSDIARYHKGRKP